MSKLKKKVGLISTDIRFNNYSIIYPVKLENGYTVEMIREIVISCNDIKNKDLILKPTIFDKENQEVIFTPSNVIPHFYQSIYNGTIRHIEEYVVEKNNIYNIGEVVAYILI